MRAMVVLGLDYTLCPRPLYPTLSAAREVTIWGDALSAAKRIGQRRQPQARAIPENVEARGAEVQIRQLRLRDRALDRLGGEAFGGTAIRRAVGLVAGARADGRSAAKLLLNTSIKLMTFSGGGLTATMFLGNSACFSLSLEIKTVR
jgi:hypothetical protein